MKNPLKIFEYLPYYLRKKFNEKYIIIESDDWGLERGLTEDSIRRLEKKYGRDKLTRWSYDSLETSEDLNELYEVLGNYKNKFEFPPVITANFITHNIDYSSQQKLNFIPISKGFNNENDLGQSYKTGIENKFIFPQLHGYSHYNISELKQYFDTETGREAFNEKFFLRESTVKGRLKLFHGELSTKNKESFRFSEASDVFYEMFGFRSKTVIPPTFILDNELQKMLKENGITLVQSSNRLLTSDNKKFRYPYFQKRKGMFWSVRRARLDPHEDYGYFHEQCIASVANAFDSKMPAIIDFHRVNFAGRYAPGYRARSIKELKLMFDEIYNRWPEAKFIHSQNLNDILWQQETR
ncbi:MAG: hypothetical protein IPL53_10195 [Ignavibacteria bacterium]|nr:hypothetical protein [Ignavibacteria bacterium]